MKRSRLLIVSRYNPSRVLIAVLILALEFGLGSNPASAQNAPVSPTTGSFTCTAINFPGATRTRALGLNDSGDIVGDYRDASGMFSRLFAEPRNFHNLRSTGVSRCCHLISEESCEQAAAAAHQASARDVTVKKVSPCYAKTTR